MKTELPCNVVRDLLPSYIDGLTESETADQIRDHLDSCDDCRKLYSNMTGQQEDDLPDSDENENINYLKKIRRKSLLYKAGIWILAAILLAGVGLGIWKTQIGSLLNLYQISYSISSQDDCPLIQITPSPGTRITRTSVKEENSAFYIAIRGTGGNSSDETDTTRQIALDTSWQYVKEIYINNILVCQDQVPLSRSAVLLAEYCQHNTGNSLIAAIASELQFSTLYGNYSLEENTSDHNVRFLFENTYPEGTGQENDCLYAAGSGFTPLARWQMKTQASILMGIEPDLNEVSFCFNVKNTAGETHQEVFSYTRSEMMEAHPDLICGQSSLEIQTLFNELGYTEDKLTFYNPTYPEYILNIHVDLEDRYSWIGFTWMERDGSPVKYDSFPLGTGAKDLTVSSRPDHGVYLLPDSVNIFVSDGEELEEIGNISLEDKDICLDISLNNGKISVVSDESSSE